MRVVKETLVYDQDLVSSMVEKMVILARDKPNFLQLHIASIAETMLQIARDNHLKVKTREVALKFLVTTVEAMGMILGGAVIKELVEQLLRILMMCIEDKEDIIEAMDATNNGLSWLSVALGVDVIAANSPDMLPAFFQDAADWKKRYAAVTSLGLIAAGYSNSKMFGEYLEQSVEKIMQLVADEHPLVRCAAITAIYRFSQFCSPHFQNQCHQRVIPALSHAIDDFSNTRVQMYAAVAMAQFSLCCPSIMKPHLEVMITKCLKLIQEEQTIVAVLYSLRCFAISAKDDFNQFYPIVMAHLKSILKTVEVNSNLELVAKTLSCISVVAMSVQKSVFSIDANEIVDAVSSVQRYNFSLAAKHRATSLLLKAWHGLCTSLGEDFEPYLKDSMPQLIGLAAQKDYFISHDWNGKDEERSIVLMEMVWACETLNCIATQVKGGLRLWIEEVSEKVLPLVNCELDEQVKVAAISVMPCLLQSAANATGYDLHVLANTIITALVKSLEIAETWAPDGIAIVGSLLNVLSTFFFWKSQLLKHEFKDEKNLCISKVLSACFYKKKSELLKNDEKNICTEVRNCLRVLTKRFRDQNLILQNFYVKKMWAENIIPDERRMALNIFTDIAMEGGELTLREYEEYIPLLLKACKNDSNPHIQQMAACAIGIYIEFGRETFKNHLQDAVSSLEATVVFNASINDLEHSMARDAAVCAYGKLCFFLCEEINSSNMAQYIKLWLSHLPLQCNLAEAKAAHTLLCSMMDKPETKVTGPEDSYLARIVEIMAKVLWNAKYISTKETKCKIIQQLKMLKQRRAMYEFEAICESLPPYLQNVFDIYLT